MAGRKSSRGVSLLELLVGLAIVIAAAAMALPWTMGWLSGRELDSAEDQLAMQMMMARATAREEGRPVEVVASSDEKGQRIDVRFMQDDADESEYESDSTSARRDFDAMPIAQEPDAAPRASGGARNSEGRRNESSSVSEVLSIRSSSWTQLRLPTGISVALAGSHAVSAPRDDFPSQPSKSPSTTGAAGSNATRASEVSLPPQTLAIFLPDGTAIVAPIFMLRTNAGVERTLRVDRVTGRPRSAPNGTPNADDAIDRPEFDIEPAPRAR